MHNPLGLLEKKEVRQQRYSGLMEEYGDTVIYYHYGENCFHVVTDMPDGTVKQSQAYGLMVARYAANLMNGKRGKEAWEGCSSE